MERREMKKMKRKLKKTKVYNDFLCRWILILIIKNNISWHTFRPFMPKDLVLMTAKSAP